MNRRRVVLTGAAGYVAQRMFAPLAERYDLVPIDVQAHARDGREIPGLVVCDLTDGDRGRYREHFRGADAVIHCAFVSPRGGDVHGWRDVSDGKFQAELQNVGMAYNVYRTCLEEGVRRVVVASSNHAADWYERLIWADRFDTVTPDLMPLSDNFYGWAKAANELLGFVFASGRVADRRLQVVQWRIGAPTDEDIDRVASGDRKALHRALGAWLSRRDQVQQAIRMVEAPNIEDENGVPFLIVYGISGNAQRFWSIVNARRRIGYEPQDDSQIAFAEKIAGLLRRT